MTGTGTRPGEALRVQPPLLEARGIGKTFPGVRALDDVSFTLGYGEVLGLVGENGAGKSTLMNLLTGVSPMESGEFLFEGEPLDVHGVADAMAKGISIVHQELSLTPDLTVEQNIYIGREPRNGPFLDKRTLHRNAVELLDRLHITIDPATPVSRMSVAHQQMVEIAKALSFDPRVLVLDEPTSPLNDAEVDALLALIREFVTPQTGVIYITHRLEELGRISDRITVMRDGRTVDTLTTRGTTQGQLVSKMVGRSIDTSRTPDPIDPDSPVLLQVEGLSTAKLLKDVSLDVHAGEIVGLAGLVGAGRTELGRAIVGADPITSGTIRLRGQEVHLSTPALAARHRIGYLSEDRKDLALLLSQSVTHNVALSAMQERFTRAGFVRDAAMEAEAEKQRTALSIKTPSIDQLVQNLSGGNQQKVAIARWLAKDCDVLIFDEPTRGIDVGAKEEIYGLLDNLAAQGRAIIMISSELPEILRMSHRIAVMCEGEVEGILPAADATEEKILQLATRTRADDVDVDRVVPISETEPA